MEKDDYLRFKDILENGLKIKNNNNYLKIKVKSFFTPRCVESIYDQKLRGKKNWKFFIKSYNLKWKQK